MDVFDPAIADDGTVFVEWTPTGTIASLVYTLFEMFTSIGSAYRDSDSPLSEKNRDLFA